MTDPDSDAKEWVTIKVPKAVRNDARDDPRTYGEIMRDGLDYADVDADDHQAAEGGQDPRVSDAFADIAVQLDRIEAAATTAEERTGTIERTLEEMSR